MSAIEQEARRVAEWVLEPGSGPARPGPEERLWLAVSQVAGGVPRVWAWSSGRTSPGAWWVGVDWPAGAESPTVRARMVLERAIAAALEGAE